MCMHMIGRMGEMEINEGQDGGWYFRCENSA